MRKFFKKWWIGVLLILIVGGGSYFVIARDWLPTLFEPKPSVEELNSKADAIVKELNQFLYDQHMEKAWYATVSKSEVIVNDKGEAIIKIFSKDYVKNGKEDEILKDCLSFFDKQIFTKYKMKSVKVDIYSPDNQFLAGSMVTKSPTK